jgi:hypothetical protein
MAHSPAHKWGQIVGQEFLEVALAPILRETAKKHGLFLDVKGKRPARSGLKISWADDFGNAHDLDFVLERGGTADKIGDPVAFIETAWRRYTKHSRNKAQEVQGAVLPLVTRHHRHAPFFGVMLAGEWTEGAVKQLASLGFKVLHFTYEDIVSAFAKFGIDAGYGEETSNAECATKIKAWSKLSAKERVQLGRHLLKSKTRDVAYFVGELEKAITRQIEAIRILPLHGSAVDRETVKAAIEFVEAYNELSEGRRPLAKYEVQVRFNNSDQVNASFSDKEQAVSFLKSYLPPVHPVSDGTASDADIP